MYAVFALLFFAMSLGLILLMRGWLYYYRKIMLAAVEYVGENPEKTVLTLKPSEHVILKLNGKTTIIVSGVNSWITLKYNGIKQKIYKVRLINHHGEVELINESKVFTVNVIILKEYHN
ncbi:hypothetical protein [Stygiolobus caldivivus]|uniref:Uncharacterized protein n=1 Tax=Stygiolobus caldivivus TaxID=2824673 RepID=A0A8D5U4S2_9CREN|nr:hypothetical protein [Stygiolobus caldivivus]BCU69258.1 hypothetical protein KN1_05550 [Stygiolobus caldivivus]